MIEDFNLAPLGGEITRGGLSTICAGKETSFGRMKVKEDKDIIFSNFYTLERVLNDYACHDMSYIQDNDSLISSLKREIKNGKERTFSNINIILVYLSRAKQLGINIDQFQPQDLLEQINATVQIFYLILLIDKYIQPDFNVLKENTKDMAASIYTHLDFHNLKTQIIQSQLNLKTIYNNPTSENLAKVIDLLSVPKESMVIGHPYDEAHEVKLPTAKLFTMKTNYTDNLKQSAHDKHDAQEFIYALINGGEHGDALNKLLTSYAKNRVTPQYLQTIASKLSVFIKELEKRENIVNNLIQKDCPALSAQQQFFINNHFPVIFIIEDANKLYLFSASTSEYRTEESLQLGKDIKMIATDTDEHRLILMKYFEQNHIHNVSVVLFIDLLLCKQTQLHPQSPYTHADGLQRLSWFAAKAAPPMETKTGIDGVDRMLERADAYKRRRLG